MLEDLVRQAGAALDAFWQKLVDVADGSHYGPDRTVARNVVHDPQLGHRDFRHNLAPEAAADVLTFFAQWEAECNGGAGLHVACETVFRRAYKAVAAAGNGVDTSSPETACLRLALLGFGTENLTDQHCGEWVSFLRYTVPSEPDFLGDDAKAGAGFYTRPDRLTAPVVREFQSRPLRWFACKSTLLPLLDGSPPGGRGVPEFDAVRDLLGLYWRPDNRHVVGVVVPTLRQAPLGRVPTFFDSGGFEYFRPASGEWYDLYHCGCTCPINIREMRPPGVAELIAWVAADPPPAHAGPATAARPELSVLHDSAGAARVFAVERDPDVTDYHARRG